MRRLCLTLLALLWLAAPGIARADEHILSFLSDVSVGNDGTLTVTESIRIHSEGMAINHGIYRDFPTRYRNRLGRQVRVGFEMIDAERDGMPEKWDRSPVSNGVRIRIGDAAKLLPPGEHLYRLRYTTTRQLGFFDDFDELYWNATGNGWPFPIDVAEVRITLPKPVPFGQRHAYTGPQGSQSQDAKVIAEEPGMIAWRTTVPLAPYEGLTVAVAWPKGVIAPPAQKRRLGWWMEDNGPAVAACLGLFAILAYYVFAWWRAGRGPRPGTIVPIFAPPDGLSAAGMRYVNEMGSDSRGFAAALVDLGVRGKLRLVEGKKRFFGRPKMTIEHTGEAVDLPPAERQAVTELFAGGDTIVMENANHARFRAAEQALAKAFKKQYEGSLFVRNIAWSLRGLALTFLAIWLVAFTIVVTDSSGAVHPMASLFGVGALLAFLIAGLLMMVRPESGTIVLRVLAGIVGLVGTIIGVITIGMALGSGRILPMLVPLLALPVVISAFWWMAAPTRQGRSTLDRIAGFRQYLSITEEDRLERMHPPERTPELFERFLPYAIALEVENDWADGFAGVLAAAAVAGQARTMGWYSGHSDPWAHPGDFAARMGSSLTSTVSSASTAPGSSSGSGGGGSSGGGGGGGGGGGW